MSKTKYIPLHNPPLKPRRNKRPVSYVLKAERYLTNLYKTPVLLVSSCTHALEIIAELLNLNPKDEVIAPSYTFISSIQPFFRKGARLIFADVDPFTANIDIEDTIRKITPSTKIIIAPHYAGSSTDMSQLTSVCKKSGIILIEDAAQAYGSRWKNKLLGTFGALSAISFDKSKNITSDRGGALIINDQRFLERARVIRSNGSNLHAFNTKKVDAYTWIDVGSQYGMAEPVAKDLWPQLSKIDSIISYRSKIVLKYRQGLNLPPSVYSLKTLKHSQTNYHIFALVFPTQKQRDKYINFMAKHNIQTAFHYQALHISPFAQKHIKWQGELPGTQKLNAGLVRLPLNTHLKSDDIARIISTTNAFFT